MISTSSANIVPDRSHTASDTSTRREASGFVKLPVPAIEFQQHILPTARPVDEVTIAGAARSENGGLPADRTREQRQAPAPATHVSETVSLPVGPDSEPNVPASVDLSSEPPVAASDHRWPSEDRLQLSDQARVLQEAETKDVDRRLRAEQVNDDRLQQVEQQHREQARPQDVARDGRSGQQPFNRLV